MLTIQVYEDDEGFYCWDLTAPRLGDTAAYMAGGRADTAAEAAAEAAAALANAVSDW